MGYHDDRAGVFVDEGLQPFNGRRIEVVRGLIEDQELGTGDELPAESYSPSLAAAHGGGGGVGVRYPQGLHRHIALVLPLPAVDQLDLLLQPAHLAHQLFLGGYVGLV